MPKLKATLVAEFDYDMERWPGAKTIAEFVEKERRYLANGGGASYPSMIQANGYTVTVEPMPEDDSEDDEPKGGGR